MPPMPPNNNTTNKGILTPYDLSNQLLGLMMVQCNNNPGEAAHQVATFLTEALLCLVSSTVRDEGARKELLKQIGEAIASGDSNQGGQPTPQPSQPKPQSTPQAPQTPKQWPWKP